jgi:hypothetical protein
MPRVVDRTQRRGGISVTALVLIIKRVRDGVGVRDCACIATDAIVGAGSDRLQPHVSDSA